MGSFGRPNGWQRLWIVISIGLLLYLLPDIYSVTVKGFLSGIDDDQIEAGYKNPACKTVVEMPLQGELDPSPEYGTPCWPVYMYRNLHLDAPPTANDFRIHVYKRKLIAVSINLGVWLALVAALYAAGAVVAWVIRGFRSKPLS